MYFFFFFCVLTTVYGFQYKIDDMDIRYNISSFKTCVKIPDTLKLTPIMGVSLNKCVANCASTSVCEGLIYKNKYPLCERYREGNVEEHNGSCVHVKRDDIDIDTVYQSCNTADSECFNNECPYPNITNGKPEGNMFTAGSTQTIKCDIGYDIKGNNTINCMQNGTWTKLPECMKKECPYPNITNGKQEGHNFTAGSTHTISCKSDYVINGNNTIKCMENGTWTNLPECWKKCSEMPDIEFAVVDRNNTHTNVNCNESYVINTSLSTNVTENITVTCDKNGVWTPSVECTHINNMFNVALHKNASQSSTSSGGAKRGAIQATDGIWDPNMSDSQSCSHTEVYKKENETNPWWVVDLQGDYSVKSVWVLNRNENTRLKNFKVLIGNDTMSMDECANLNRTAPRGCTTRLNCTTPIVGRYVKITKQNDVGAKSEDNLALCEVGVYEDQSLTPIDLC